MIRTMTHDDLDAIWALELTNSNRLWSKEDLINEFNNAYASVFVNTDNEIIGYAFLRIYPDTPPKAEISNLFVHPHYRRNGIGKQLTQDVVDAAHTIGITEVAYIARQSNEAIHKLSSNHFTTKQVEVVNDYHPDVDEPMVVYIGTVTPSKGH